MDKVIEALRTCVVDDVHLCITIADLLESLTTNLRSRFVRIAVPGLGGVENHSRARTPMIPSRVQTPHRPDQLQSWTASRRESAAQHLSPDNNSDPLADIPIQSIDSTMRNVSFMPPPEGFPAYQSYHDQGQMLNNGQEGGYGQGMHADDGGGTAVPDWFALPLDPFFNSSATAVDQGFGGIGPIVGNYDMLEVILNGEMGDGGTGAGHFMGYQ